jgi:hypothetical protein
MTDHHDFGDHDFGGHDFGGHEFADHDFGDHHDYDGGHDDHLTWEPPEPHPELSTGHDGPFDPDGHDPGGHDPDGHDPDGQDPAPDGPPEHAELSDLPDAELSDSVFPPTVDVGELPEPVDGFPWIDTGSLGLADLRAALHDSGPATEAVPASELAEYAHVELPEGADAWQALADSDDPATAALAKWWSQQN